MQFSQRLFFLLASLGTARASKTQLPSQSAAAHAAQPRSSKWWVHVGDKVLYSPPASMISLSQDVSDYYYAIGSADGVLKKLQERRVGGEGRWHVFHLPEGAASFLQTANGANALASSGDRRASLSALKRLSHGVVLASQFPTYAFSQEYRHPLDESGQAAERKAVESLTPEGIMSTLREITTVPTDGAGHHTRSWTDAAATERTTSFIQQKFSSMGLKSCMQNFESDGNKLANVIGYIPGKAAGSVVVGAHYDSRPFNGDAPGAEDNGSGLASLLAIAQAYKQAGVVPRRHLYFVGFAAEEPGLKGSAVFAHALNHSSLPAECRAGAGQSFLQSSASSAAARRENRNSAIVLDEVGWLSPNLAKKTVNLESYDWSTEVLEDMAQASRQHNNGDLEVVHSSNPFGSDHMSFLDMGTPAVLAINGDDEKYPHYHQSSDSIDNVDPEYMAQIGRMVLGATFRQAGVHASSATA